MRSVLVFVEILTDVSISTATILTDFSMSTAEIFTDVSISRHIN